MRILTLLASTVLLLISQSYAQIRINEVCASNSESLYDEDSDTPDWIELYNYSDQPVNLSTWKISDKPDSKLAWQFPDTVIQPKKYIIVHASNKNRTSSGNFAMHIKGYNSIVAHNNRDGFRIRYKKIVGDFEADVSIRSMSNEGHWGSAGLQVRETLSDTTKFVSALAMSKQRSDIHTFFRETVLYSPGWKPLYGNTNLPYAKMWMKRQNDSIYVGYKGRNDDVLKMEVFPNFLNESLYLGVSVSGNNENKFAKFVVRDFILDGKNIPFSDLEAYEVNTNEQGYDYNYNELHTDFSIKDDETIYLYNDSKLKDSVKLQPMTGDVTNIFTDSNLWRITDIPTPGETNGVGYLARLSKPVISFVNDRVELSVTNDASIRYELDNSLPNNESNIYPSSQEIVLNKTTVVKAIAYKEGYLPSFVQSELIRINEPNTNLPIVSISANTDDLWGENGILIEKNLFFARKIDANFNYYFDKKWISQNISLKVHGNNSKYYPQKSFRLYANENYEKNSIENLFFDTKVKKFSQMVLRNGGTDWSQTFIKDAYNGVIAKQIGSLISAAYTPALSYLNSEFYGLINIRERLNDDYLAEYYKIDKDNINYYEDNGDFVSGDFFRYNKYYNFILENEFVEDNKYNLIDSLVDINNFINYTMFGIYAANYDWPWKNIKLYQSDELDNKFRYMIHDMDWTYSHFEFTPNQNKLELIVNDTFSHVSIILNKFFKNQQFKNQYLTNSADMINSVFKPDNMKFVLDSLANQVREYIPLQQQKWEESCQDWENKIENMKVFFDERPEYFIKNMNFYLNDNNGTSIFTLSTYPPNSGTFKVNTITVDTSEWSGRYFQTLPITIKAVPKHGMKFVKWNHDSLGTESTITTTLPETFELEAIYEKTNLNELDRAIVINEIMYNADKDNDTKDWIELYNAGTKSVNLKGWSILDEDISHVRFILDEDYQIQPKEFVILTKEKSEFEKFISITNSKFGDFDFGLGGNDIVRLIDENGITHDSVNYDNDEPWPVDADGTGYTIELINPSLDNNIGSNWKKSKIDLGTAGFENSSYDSLQTSVILYSNSEDIRIEQFDRIININSDDIIKNFRLYSITGKEINLGINRNIDSKYQNVDLNYIDRGVYLLIVHTNNSIETFKILLK